MIQAINQTTFCEAFKNANRVDNFGDYDGLFALYEHLEQYEEDTGEQLELDVVALCCDYSQYGSIEECLQDYSDIEDIAELQTHTTVIEYGDTNKIIIQSF